jgi:hypothetical protein
MAARPPLRIGGQISSATGVARGRIGGFATGHDGRLFALVARHVAHAEHDGLIFNEDEKLGTTRELSIVEQDWDANIPNLAAAIAAVDITDACRPIVVEEAGITVDTYFENPLDALDKRVRTLADSDDCAEGTVVWVGSRVRVLYGEDRPPLRYTDAVEVSFDQPEEVRLARGDAGMPVVDHDGRLVGLVISGTPARCFVAPVAPFLKRHNLTLYSQQGPTAEADEAVPFDQVAAGLRDASLNLSEWIRESAHRPRLFTRTADGGSALILEAAE